MGMLDDDMAAMDADALALGMADSVTYNGSSATVTFSESSEPYIGDEGAEKRRRTAMVSVRRSVVSAPVKGDRIVVASGAYAGTWTVTAPATADDGCWLLMVRLDDRTVMGGGRRLP